MDNSLIKKFIKFRVFKILFNNGVAKILILWRKFNLKKLIFLKCFYLVVDSKY